MLDSMWKSFVLLFFLRNEENWDLWCSRFSLCIRNRISCITCCHVWNLCGMIRLKWDGGVENLLFGFHFVHNFCFCPFVCLSGLTSQNLFVWTHKSKLKEKKVYVIILLSNGREWWWCEDVFCRCLCHLFDTNDYKPDYVRLSVSVLFIPHKV